MSEFIKTKEEIKKESSIGLSEDINGNFYTIYDFDKLFELMLDKTEVFIRTRLPRVIDCYDTDGYVYEDMLNEDVRADYRDFMHDKLINN